MRFHPFFTILIALFLHLASADPIEVEGGGVPAVIKNFAKVGKHLIDLDVKIKKDKSGKSDKGEKSGSVDKPAIELGHINVQLALIKSSKSVKATPRIDPKESEPVTEVVIQMKPLWQAYLHDIVVAKPEMKKAKLAKKILKHISEFQESCHKLSGELEAKVNREDAEKIAECVRDVDEDFNRAIKAYKGK